MRSFILRCSNYLLTVALTIVRPQRDGIVEITIALWVFVHA